MKLNPYLILCTAVSALGGFLFGFDTAVISGTTSTLKELYSLSDFSLGFTVAVALIGTIIGACGVGPFTDRYGRKWVLMVMGVIYLVASLGCACAWDWHSLLFFRMLGGVAVGGASVVCPLYIAEIAPARQRGTLVAVNQWNVIFGILVSYISNYVIATHVFDGDLTQAWRWMFGVQALPSIVFILMIFLIPESPRWLVKQHRLDDAEKVLSRFKYPDIPALLASIRESLHEETTSKKESFFQKKYKKPILLAFMVASFNQLSGINVLLYYAKDIFEMAGANSENALFQSALVGAINVVFTTVGLVLIDRAGRKKLLAVGSAGMAVCLGTVGYAFASGVGGKMVLAGFLGYICFFAFSTGAVIWVYISEIFPNRVRGRGQAFGSFTHWVWNAVIAWMYPIAAGLLFSIGTYLFNVSDTPAQADMQTPASIVAQADNANNGTISAETLQNICKGSPFFLFSVMMVLQLVLVIRYMPETKGVSLEEIQKRLQIE